MMTGMPHECFKKVIKRDLGSELPDAGRYAFGNIFLPQNEKERAECKKTVESIIKAQGQ